MIKKILLCFIILFGFFLRIWGVNFGLPGLFHWDERTFPLSTFYAVINYGKVGNYLYGQLVHFLLIIFYGIYYVFLKITNKINEPLDFLISFAKDPSPFYLIMRTFFVFISTILIFIGYLLAKRMYNKTIGIITAFFLSSAFILIAQSKIGKPDTLATLFLLISFYFIISKKEDYRKYILAGIFLGPAISVRINLLIVFPLIIGFIFLNKKYKIKEKLKFIIIFSFFTIFSFILVFPAIIYDFSNVISRFIEEIHNQDRPWVDPEGIPVWLFYLKEHLYYGIGAPLLISSIIGIIYSLYKRKYLFFIIFIFFYFILLNKSANFERYAIPLVPLFIIFASNFIYTIISNLPVRNFIKNFCLIFICLFFSLPNILNSIKYDYLITRPDTRNLALKFIEKNIPEGSYIINEGKEGPEHTSILGVPLRKSKKQLEEGKKEMLKRGRQGRWVDILLQCNYKPSYFVENIGPIERPYFFVSKEMSRVEINSVDFYVEKKIEYIITSSWTMMRGKRNPLPESFGLNKKYKLIKTFMPNPIFKWDYYCFRIDYKALSKVSIFDKNVIGGPIIKIYKLRSF